MTAPTIETDLGKILERIEQNLAESRRETNQRFEQLQKDLTEIKIAQARFEAEVKGDFKALQGEVNTIKTEVKGDFKALQGEVSTLKEDVRDIKGAQKAQIWSLIGILGTVVFGTVVRFVITAMPAANP